MNVEDNSDNYSDEDFYEEDEEEEEIQQIVEVGRPSYITNTFDEEDGLFYRADGHGFAGNATR